MDAVIRARDGSVAIVEAVTQIHDLQAQLRPIRLKARDMRIERVVAVVRASDRNRLRLRGAADVVSLGFPIGTRAAIRALSTGRLPDGDALVMI